MSQTTILKAAIRLLFVLQNGFKIMTDRFEGITHKLEIRMEIFAMDLWGMRYPAVLFLGLLNRFEPAGESRNL